MILSKILLIGNLTWSTTAVTNENPNILKTDNDKEICSIVLANLKIVYTNAELGQIRREQKLRAKYVRGWKRLKKQSFKMQIRYNDIDHDVFLKHVISFNLIVDLKVEIPSLDKSFILKQIIMLSPNTFDESKILNDVKRSKNTVKLIYSHIENLHEIVIFRKGKSCEYQISWMFIEYFKFNVFSHLSKLRKWDQKESEEGLIKMLKDILKALVECHNNKIVHGNIQLKSINGTEKRSDFSKIKFVLVNFRNSIQLNKNETEVPVMRNRFFRMKPFFAPEVISGLQVLTPASDIWSFGIMTFQLFYSRNNNLFDSFADKIAGMKQNKIDSKIDEHWCSNKVKIFVKRCIKINVEERATAQELLEDPLLKM